MSRFLLTIALCISTLHCQAAPKSDAYYMQLAIDLIKQQPTIPWGAVISDNTTGQVLCTGLNSSWKLHNPTLHGEIVAINNCSKKVPALKWENTTLYTTNEPCPMCQTAIIWAHIPRVVYGTSIQYMRDHGWNPINLSAEELNKLAPFYNGTVTGGVLHEKTDPYFANGSPWGPKKP